MSSINITDDQKSANFPSNSTDRNLELNEVYAITSKMPITTPKKSRNDVTSMAPTFQNFNGMED